MDDLIPIQMTTHDRAHWLADKVPQYNDYTAEAIAMLRRLADENERMRELLDDIASAIGDLPIGDTGNAGIKRCVSIMYRIQDNLK